MVSPRMFERLSELLAAFQRSNYKMNVLWSTHERWSLDREYINEEGAVFIPEEGKRPPPMRPKHAFPDKAGSGCYQKKPVLPAALQPRLVVLDASFNPPTRAHAQMAKSAIRDIMPEQRAAVGAALREGIYGSGPVGERYAARPQTQLLLLLSVYNADKPADQPVAFKHRVAMICEFAFALSEELREEGFDVCVDVGVTQAAYFSDKARAIAEGRLYSVWHHDGVCKCTEGELDEKGNKYPDCTLGSGMVLEPPPIEFLTGFDTLVRIFDPKYYKEEEEEKEDEEKGAVSSASSTASFVMVKAPVTPMREALGSFFDNAGLIVTLRPNDAWGTREEQKLHLAALARRATEDSVSVGGHAIKSLEEIGGDVKWLDKVRLLEADGDGEDVSGVSSSLVRKLVRDEGPAAATNLVYPRVLTWIEQNGLYKAEVDN